MALARNGVGDAESASGTGLVETGGVSGTGVDDVSGDGLAVSGVKAGAVVGGGLSTLGR